MTNEKPKSERVVEHYMGWAIVERERSPYLMVVGWHNGRRRKESAKSPKLSAARELIRRRVKEIAIRGKLIAPEVERTSWRDLEAILLASLEQRSPRYLASAKYRIACLRRAFGSMPATSITYGKLERYVNERTRQGASPATVRYELRMAHRAFVLGVRAERVDRLPAFPTVSVSNTRTGFASAAEVARLLEHLPEHVAPLVGLLSYTGMRSHEVLDLRWSRVDFETGAIKLRAEDTKARKPRTIPFGNLRPLAELMRRQRDRVTTMEHEEGRIIPEVFPDCSPKTFRRWWYRAAKAAKLEGLTPHDLRRSAARNLIRAGVSQHVAMAILGHSTLSMFTRYNITSADDLVEGMGRLDAFVAKATAPPNAPLESTRG